jgi:hypothetical protein
MPAGYPKRHSKSKDGRFVFENAKDPYFAGSAHQLARASVNMKKKPGSFSKRYKKAQKRERSIPDGKTYGTAEKIKLIREFESLNAPFSIFCKWYGLNPHTFKTWKQRFLRDGDAGLEDGRKSRAGRDRAPLPEDIRADIIRIKLENQGIGAHKISDWLARNRFVRIGSQKVMQVLRGDHRTAPLIPQGRKLMRGNSGKEPQHFERSKPREMYQMDIMTFMLHGLYRVYVIGCLDDYSRFIVSLGLFRRQTTDRCLDVLKSAIEKYFRKRQKGKKFREFIKYIPEWLSFPQGYAVYRRKKRSFLGDN